MRDACLPSGVSTLPHIACCFIHYLLQSPTTLRTTAASMLCCWCDCSHTAAQLALPCGTCHAAMRRHSPVHSPTLLSEPSLVALHPFCLCTLLSEQQCGCAENQPKPWPQGDLPSCFHSLCYSCLTAHTSCPATPITAFPAAACMWSTQQHRGAASCTMPSMPRHYCVNSVQIAIVF